MSIVVAVDFTCVSSTSVEYSISFVYLRFVQSKVKVRSIVQNTLPHPTKTTVDSNDRSLLSLPPPPPPTSYCIDLDFEAYLGSVGMFDKVFFWVKKKLKINRQNTAPGAWLSNQRNINAMVRDFVIVNLSFPSRLEVNFPRRSMNSRWIDGVRRTTH